MVVFSPIFVADTKIIFRYDFVAPLSDWLTTIFFNFWKNQKYQFIINLFTSLLQMKLFKSSQQRCSVKKGFQGPGPGSRARVQGPGPGPESRVQGPGPGFRSSRIRGREVKCFCRKPNWIKYMSSFFQ